MPVVVVQLKLLLVALMVAEGLATELPLPSTISAESTGGTILKAAICPIQLPLPAVVTVEYEPVPVTVLSAPPYVPRELVEPPFEKPFSCVNEFDQALILVLAPIVTPAINRSLALAVVTVPEDAEVPLPVEDVVLTASSGLDVTMALYS